MSRLVLMLLLFWECPTEASVPPVISFSPNWNPVVSDDSVTLTCNLDPNPEGEKRYSWYRDNKELSHYEKNYTIQAAHIQNSGYYQCQAGTSEKSDAVRLDFRVGPVILQAPPSVREGHSLSFRCHSHLNNDTGDAQYYQNGTIMESSGTGSVLQAGKAHMNMTGTYRCAKEFAENLFPIYSDEELIYVAGAGIKPVVTINPEWGKILLNDSVTLSCIVASTKSEIQRYVWYKDGDWIPGEQKNFTLENAQEKDIGNYQCQIPGSERSDPVKINIKSVASVRPVVSFSPNWVPLLYDDSVTLTCNLNPDPEGEKRYSWYRDNKELGYYKKSFTIQAASPYDRGYHQCQAGASEKSDALYLGTTYGPVILQTPPLVSEGDSMSLRCHSHLQNVTRYNKFYRNGNVMEPPGTGSILQAGKALKTMTGTYKCAKGLSEYLYPKYSRESFLYVTGAGIKPVVSFDPKWDKILLNDSVTLSCNVEPTIEESRRYVWYKDGDWIRKEEKTFKLENAEEKDGGNYQCQIPGSERSDPVRLDVKSGDFILQVPLTVHEGDLLFLRCHSSSNYLKSNSRIRKNITLYKDNEPIKYSVTESPVMIERADKNTSGTYKCIIAVTHLSDEQVVSVTGMSTWSRDSVHPTNMESPQLSWRILGIIPVRYKLHPAV
ncbi:Fc receptor-like protein 5 [Xenopus laevis]|uniref:Fc receptor-like protein 5 n=1 Tax=Xenopus laevis TaxID=8355 RepID=A0A8J1LMR7_XENLA|nr:Fc receptor-like protein 5 [Xenopus laevis]